MESIIGQHLKVLARIWKQSQLRPCHFYAPHTTSSFPCPFSRTRPCRVSYHAYACRAREAWPVAVAELERRRSRGERPRVDDAPTDVRPPPSSAAGAKKKSRPLQGYNERGTATGHRHAVCRIRCLSLSVALPCFLHRMVCTWQWPLQSPCLPTSIRKEYRSPACSDF